MSRKTHMLSEADRARIYAKMHMLANAAYGTDDALAEQAYGWAFMAGQLGFLWEDEIEPIHAALRRYNIVSK